MWTPATPALLATLPCTLVAVVHADAHRNALTSGERVAPEGAGCEGDLIASGWRRLGLFVALNHNRCAAGTALVMSDVVPSAALCVVVKVSDRILCLICEHHLHRVAVPAAVAVELVGVVFDFDAKVQIVRIPCKPDRSRMIDDSTPRPAVVLFEHEHFPRVCRWGHERSLCHERNALPVVEETILDHPGRCSSRSDRVRIPRHVNVRLQQRGGAVQDSGRKRWVRLPH